MFCKKCNTKLDINDRYCYKCGTKVEKNVKKNNDLLIIIILIPIIFIFFFSVTVGILFIYRNIYINNTNQVIQDNANEEEVYPYTYQNDSTLQNYNGISLDDYYNLKKSSELNIVVVTSSYDNNSILVNDALNALQEKNPNLKINYLYAEYLNDKYLIFITADTTILFFNKDIMELTNISSFMDANLKL